MPARKEPKMPAQDDDLTQHMEDLKKADEILARVRANPAAVNRLATLARLATGRALADNNNNCICTRAASRAGQVE
jgi:hypothetical protein